MQMYNDKVVNNRWEGCDNMELIELRIAAGSTQQIFNFTDQPQLDGMEIQAIETLSVNDIPVSPISGLALPPADIWAAANLQLYNSQKYGIDELTLRNGAFKYGINYWPLPLIHRLDNGTDPYVREMPYMACNTIQWLKSSVVFGATQTFSADIAFVFCVYYSSKVPSKR